MYNTREAIAFLVTQPNVYAAFQRLSNRNQLQNSDSVQRELRRLGHFAG